MKLSLLFFICAFVATCAFGQSEQKGKTSLRVLGNQNQPLENATVELLRRKDSVLVKTAISDKNGVAEFDGLFFNSYLFRISHVNHATAFSPSFIINANNLIAVQTDISLTPKAAKQMEGVTVTAKKPFIQKLNDRIVVNVESSSVNAGS